ncbi:MAG: hypothetical protein FJ098_04155, partial [Deltaproteobacteria bacterium]|nr:hypothetical protein [Deltaproteobacteria bacterium]
MKAMWVLLVVVCSSLTPACSPQGSEQPGRSDFGGEGTGDSDVAAPPRPWKLDVLWVVDNSASMCQEQRALVEHIGAFVDALPEETVGELRMAVTTTDVLMGQGEFVAGAAEKYPNACAETRIVPCTEDADCAALLSESWICNPPPFIGDEFLMENLNGSLNSSCTFGCVTDQECCDEFCPQGDCGPCTYQCVAPGGASSEKDCVEQPIPCEEAPEGDWGAWARCHLQAGASQGFTAGLEGGIKAAWMALDPEGLNPDQAAAFNRPDAHLLVVLVSDEEDCSISEDFCGPTWECDGDSDCPGYTRCKGGHCCGVIKKDYYNICGLLGEYGDGPVSPDGYPEYSLARVDEYAERLGALKVLPQRVLVVTISGDAVVSPDDSVTLISEACLARDDLDLCQAYKTMKDAADPS